MTDITADMERFSTFLMDKMFQLKEGESVAISADSGSDKLLVEALMKAAEQAGGKPFVLYVSQSEYDGQAGMRVWPAKPLTAALSHVDVWIDIQSIVMLYSEIWENAMAQNKKLRYLVLGDTGLPSLIRTFMSFDIPTLKSLLVKVQAMVLDTKKVRITSQNGTDVSYDIDLAYAFDYDDGDYSEPTFGTAPGYVNIVPKLGSMNGTIVFDELMFANLKNGSVVFEMKNGAIVSVSGSKEADKYSEFLHSFDDPNMFKISHNMLGLNPGVRELTGDIVEDERIWGGVDFGFGHTSPMDMPPHGQVAKSHFDGVVEKATVFLDKKMLFSNGELSISELIPLGQKLLKEGI